MNASTLTIRLPQEQRNALREIAKAVQKTESEYIRDLIVRDLAAVPFGERLGDLVGSLNSAGSSAGQEHPLKDRIRARNWRQ